MKAGYPGGELDELLQRQYHTVAGVDEVGRGALAGPVTAAAVVLDPVFPVAGLADSKVLTPARRRKLADEIRSRSQSWAVVHVSASKVDRMNILEATRLAMRLAVRRLTPAPDCVVTDAVSLNDLAVPVLAEIGADGRYRCVAAAAILAKVERDDLMARLAVLYPGYGWERNRGYGVSEHLSALARLGPTPLHRRSFAPLRVLA